MNPSELLQVLLSHRLAIEASVSESAAPQAAVIGIAATDRFEIVFDALQSSRKIQNLRRNPKIALVLGGWLPGDERTIQYEGMADEPEGAERDRLTTVYYAAFPDGPSRLSWPGLVYIRVRPTWIRFSDFNQNPPKIVEFTADELR